MSRKLYGSVAVVVLGCLALVVVGSAGASTSPTRHQQRLVLVLRGGTSTFVDTGKQGPSVGDEVILNQGAFWASNGQRAGRGIVKITLLGTSNSSQTQDEANLVLAAGQIAVEGIQTSQRTFNLAVIGGTGAYRDARGQVRVTLLSQNASRAVVSLTG
jgi:hypothetical protein